MTIQRAVTHRPSLARLRSALDFWYLLYRFPAFGFSLLLPVLGAATVADDGAPGRLLGLAAIAGLFHGFVYISNDLIDLRLDRSEPMRAEYPLVRGEVGKTAALVLALAHVPLSFLLAAYLGSPPSGLRYLLLAYVLLTIYNVCGKRCPFPPLTDAVQALGWCALVLFGAATAGAGTTSDLLHLLAYVFVYVLLINGVHGPLRDLPNDYRRGARTTAILLGARPGESTRTAIPRGLGLYALLLQAGLLGITSSQLRSGTFGGNAGLAIALTVPLSIAACALTAAPYFVRHDDLRLQSVGSWHLVATLAVLPAAFGPTAGGTATATAFALFLVPVVALWLRNRRPAEA